MRLAEAEGRTRDRGERRQTFACRAGFLCLALLLALFARAEAETTHPGPQSGPAARADTVRAQGSQPSALSVQPGLRARLQVLAEALHKEIVLCLHGDVYGDTALLTRLTMPDPRRSDTDSARFGPCPADALAAWHNHPEPPPGIRAPRPVAEVGAADLCRLSDTDIRTAARAGHPFVVVSADASTLCWWTLQEVRDLARPGSSRTVALRVY